MTKVVSKKSTIKRAQKESTILRLVASLCTQAAKDIVAFQSVVVTRVLLSPGKSVCRIYLYVPQGKDYFRNILPDLTLYKPSLRKALADTLSSRYAADLIFVFDEQLEKTMRIESLLDSIKEDSVQYDSPSES